VSATPLARTLLVIKIPASIPLLVLGQPLKRRSHCRLAPLCPSIFLQHVGLALSRAHALEPHSGAPTHSVHQVVARCKVVTEQVNLELLRGRVDVGQRHVGNDLGSLGRVVRNLGRVRLKRLHIHGINHVQLFLFHVDHLFRIGHRRDSLVGVLFGQRDDRQYHQQRRVNQHAHQPARHCVKQEKPVMQSTHQRPFVILLLRLVRVTRRPARRGLPTGLYRLTRLSVRLALRTAFPGLRWPLLCAAGSCLATGPFGRLFRRRCRTPVLPVRRTGRTRPPGRPLAVRTTRASLRCRLLRFGLLRFSRRGFSRRGFGRRGFGRPRASRFQAGRFRAGRFRFRWLRMGGRLGFFALRRGVVDGRIRLLATSYLRVTRHWPPLRHEMKID